MKRVVGFFVCVAGLALSAACSNKSPLDPIISQATGSTRVIGVTADVNFGNVPVGSTATRDITITNTGTGALTVQALTVPGGSTTSGYSTTYNGSTIAAGASQTVTISFAPTLGTTYPTTFTAVANQTSGTNTISVTGTGTVDHIPLYTRSGTGDSTFILPTHISRMRVFGHFVDTGGPSNFQVAWQSVLIINGILRTGDFDETLLLTGGGPIQIQNSANIEWSFTEVR